MRMCKKIEKTNKGNEVSNESVMIQSTIVTLRM